MINPIQDSLRTSLNDPNLEVSTEALGDFLIFWVVPSNKKAKISYTVSTPALKQDGTPRALSAKQVAFITTAAHQYITEHSK